VCIKCSLCVYCERQIERQRIESKDQGKEGEGTRRERETRTERRREGERRGDRDNDSHRETHTERE
jgi:hypothetical protein